jgi:hypothetical protein
MTGSQMQLRQPQVDAGMTTPSAQLEPTRAEHASAAARSHSGDSAAQGESSSCRSPTTQPLVVTDQRQHSRHGRPSRAVRLNHQAQLNHQQSILG